MGTRSLTCVIKDKKPVVAQYTHYDGYPANLGTEILDFLKDTGYKKLNAMLAYVRFTKTQKLVNEDRVSDLLVTIAGNKDRDIIYLSNDYDFGYDSLMCEFAYVIDLDKKQFNVYLGFNKQKLDWSEQVLWYRSKPDQRGDGGYYGVKFADGWHFATLPTTEEFVERIENIENKRREERENA